MLHTGTDIVVQSADGNIVALVETKNREHLTPELAADFRRNLIAHVQGSRAVPYFLLVSQDRGFFWDQRAPLPPDSPPTVEFSMQPVIERYLRTDRRADRLLRSELDIVVGQWLFDLTTGDDERSRQPEAILARTGFLDLIRGGRVSTDGGA